MPAVLKGRASRTVANGALMYRLEAPTDLVTASPKGESSAGMAARIVYSSFRLDGA